MTFLADLGGLIRFEPDESDDSRWIATGFDMSATRAVTRLAPLPGRIGIEVGTAV